uniref:Si:dkey-86e18.1 n=1 Tax=Paramormyrops kingsleyae TaxID=1676925 RepID=A0A3B3S9V8_9TELE
MARNEEKQFGKLNRLWLQKEKEEGRIKVPDRPKLSSLNTAASVKKWIPSIKNEMEYYLQQSQLSHYPERKIAEFHKRIQDLEREYKLHVRKLRTLDPTYRHHPWTPRAYTKKRNGESVLRPETSTNMKSPINYVYLSNMQSLCPQDLPGQDQPLSFNTDRLPLIVGRSRAGSGSRGADGLTQALLSGLPNLQSSPLAQALSAQRGGVAAATSSSCAPQNTPHVLGLASYWSSDEDT